MLYLKAGARMGRLVVGDQDQLGTVKGGPDLDLSYVPYYFGGVDPEFDRERLVLLFTNNVGNYIISVGYVKFASISKVVQGK